MNRYAHVENGVVTNVSMWDGKTNYNPPDGVTMVLADENTRIGGTYDGSFHFVEPPIPEPTAEQVAASEIKASAIGKLKGLGLNDAEIASITGG